jgi:hypothetical protein
MSAGELNTAAFMGLHPQNNRRASSLGDWILADIVLQDVVCSVNLPVQDLAQQE